MPTNNAINLNATGIAKYDGAGAFSATTTTNHAVLIGAAANAINNLGPLTNGQLVIGSTGNDPSAAGLTPGPGISITSGAGSITVAAVGGGLAWTTQSASTALVNNNGFVAISPGGALSFSLPATSSVGDVVALTLDGATSWTITQPNAGSRIRIGASQTTLGVGGSLTSTAQGDTIILVCHSANALWSAISLIGNITVT